MADFSVNFSCYGIGISVEGKSRFLFDSLIHDFAFFQVPNPVPESLKIRIFPAEDRPLHWRHLFSAKASTLYWPKSGEHRTELFPQSWVAYRFRAKQADIYCSHPEVAYETVYSVILSYWGERLNAAGKLRTHGLGIVFGGKSILFMGKSGVGKSTLGMKLLAHPAVKLLSDDLPIISGERALAFPQRIGLKEKPADPKLSVRVFSRVHYGRKFVVGSESFREKIRESAPLSAIVLLSRGSGEGAFQRLTRFSLIVPLVRWLVLGLETPQIWQLFLRADLRDFFFKARCLSERIQGAFSLFWNCPVYSLSLASPEASAALVLNGLLQEIDSGARTANHRAYGKIPAITS